MSRYVEICVEKNVGKMLTEREREYNYGRHLQSLCFTPFT